MLYHIFLASKVKGEKAKPLSNVESIFPIVESQFITLDEKYADGRGDSRTFYRVIRVEHTIEVHPESKPGLRSHYLCCFVYVEECK